MKIKRIGIDTYRENVAYLSRACPLYRAEEFQALAKIEVHGNGRTILASLNIVEDQALLGPDEIGLSETAFATLALPEGHEARVMHPTPPASLDAVRAKIQGRTLTPENYTAIIRDIAAHRYSKMEIAAFLIAAASFMTTEEVLSLTRAMAEAGNRLHWDTRPIVDKHCIGGIPGNRTSMIVVPIVAAHGLTIPKTSSRAITSPAGTADTMQVLARVDIGLGEMHDIVRRTKGCLVWGGRVNLSPADDVLISVERPLGIDTREQMVASILSKKLAAGATHLIIDIPVGPTAKVRSVEDAVELRQLFEHIGDAIGLDLEAVVTDGSQPIGRGIGPVLEARDVLQVLEGDRQAPRDLRERALLLAGRVLEIDGGLRGGQGYARAKALLDSGAARAKLQEIIAAQGEASGDLTSAPLVHDVCADADGAVAAIDCVRIARIARLAGAPLDPGSGVDLACKLGERTERGQPLYRIHARYASDFAFAKAYADEDNGYAIGRMP